MVTTVYWAIAKLQTIPELSNINLLRAYDKKFIKQNEDPNNIGVLKSIERQFTLVVTHDSNFRGPDNKITIERNGSIIFPPVPFPELKGKNVISASPSSKIHNYLVERFKMHLKNEEATLLIGFDS